MRPTHPSRTRARRGNALVEGALVMTAFMMILFGIMDFARAIFVYNTTQFAAREGARYASVRGSASGDTATSDTVRDYALGLMAGVPTSDVTVTTTWTPNNTPGSYVTVAVNATFTPITPYMRSGTWNLSGTSKLMISQ